MRPGTVYVDFVEFYQATSRRTLRYAYGLTGDLPQAQDVVQEAYARAWQRWRKVAEYDDSEAWLRLVVTRLVFDWWRHLGVRRKALLERPAPVAPPSEDTVLLTTALKQLPPAQRRALALHYLLDLPIAEIAIETGVPEGTVKSWLSRGRAGLADALREETEAAVLPVAEATVERGRSRSRTRTAVTLTAACLAVLATLALTVAVLRGRGTAEPPPPASVPTASPIAFQRLTQVGRVDVKPPRLSMATIAGGRGVFSWYDEGRITVGAVDLATGREAWRRPIPDRYGDWMGTVVLPDAIITIGERDNGTVPDKEMYVLDPATGTIRWHRGMDVNGFDILFTLTYVILADHQRRTTIAVDLGTGEERWQNTAPNGIAVTVGTHDAADLTGPQMFGGGSAFGPLVGGDAFYQLAGDGVLTEYAVGSGQATGRAWGGVPVPVEGRPNSYLAYEGSLYIVDGGGLRRLDFDTGGLVELHRSESQLRDPIPCGDTAMCILENDAASGASRLIILPTARIMNRVDGHTAVTVDLPARADLIVPMDPLVLVRTETTDGTSAWGLFNSEGEQAFMHKQAHYLKVDGGNLLAYEPTGSGEDFTTGRLFGVNLATRNWIDLGTISAGMFGPATDGQHVLTATPDGFVLYRIT